MVPYYPDIFNDVFGPVMQPGSSSHTAGPLRIGYEAYCILGETPADILIRLDDHGSFTGTFGMMYEDLGMLSGAAGLQPDDRNIFNIHDILNKKGISHRFERCRLKTSRHPNAVEFCLSTAEGRKVCLTGNSTGGGRIEVVNINGAACRYVGDCWYYGILFPAGAAADTQAAFRLASELQVHCLKEADNGNGQIVYGRSDNENPKLSLWQEKTIQAAPGVFCFCMKPVLPVCAGDIRKEQIFRDMEEWRTYAARHDISLPEAVIHYEKASSGFSREEILKKMEELHRLMERQTSEISEDDDLLENPFSGYHFRQWKAYSKAGSAISGDCLSKALQYTFSVQVQRKGVCLVPGPMGTGGGFLYSAIRAVSESLGISNEGVMQALLTAAGVGLIAYTRGNPTGEEMGCMGECGVCSAMASAGITQMCGGTPRQVEQAASLALQMAFGWPCDPIPGGYNQPCLSRYVTAVVMSIVFADLALSGRNAVLPFHEVFDQSAALSKAMGPELKCTSQGGLCKCPAVLSHDSP